MKYKNNNVALIIPCYNEALTISQVINNFKSVMPELVVYIFDNMSTDDTKKQAIAAGANVSCVNEKGKGNVVRRMFADIDADIYVMVDGDDTYDAAVVGKLIDKLIDNDLDMVVGCRKVEPTIAKKAYRAGHQLGNKLLTQSVCKLFGGRFTDMLSGYRVFTKRYVKSFPALSKGFEIETELTVHALELRMPYGEVITNYTKRPEGSESKLSTYRDGARILKAIVLLFMREKPLTFFGIIFTVFALSSITLALPVLQTFLATGTVPRLPTAILSATFMLAGFLSLSCGLILDCVTLSRHENKRLTYLSLKK